MVLSPGPTTVPAKRRLSDSTSHVNGVAHNQSNGGGDAKQSPEQQNTASAVIRDIWDVLKSTESSASIIDHIASFRPDARHAAPPANKRAKLAAPKVSDTLEANVVHDEYSSVDAFVSDVEQGLQELSQATLKDDPDMNGSSQWQYWRQTPQKGRLEGRIRAMRKLLRSMADREHSRQESMPHTNGVASGDSKDEKPMVNGDVIKKEEMDIKPLTTDQGRTVLTVFANAQGHKQLFSSFQQPPPKPSQPLGLRPSSVPATMPLRENGLPNQIASTRIMPVSPAIARHQQPDVTFRDLFAPPTTLSQLSPPKSSKAVTRSNIITWSNEHRIHEPTSDADYTRVKLPSGQWLGYSGVASQQEPSSPEAKRKQRDRTLSSGEASLAAPEGLKAQRAQAKEEALFRSAYSSFAPSKDDAGAIFPEEVKNQVWWQKAYADGEDAGIFPIDPELDDESSPKPTVNGSTLDPDEFNELKDMYDPALTDDAFQEPTTSELGYELQEISLMLEKLHSHQRIRNAALIPSNATNPPNRPTTPSSAQSAQAFPTTPTASESALHKVLTHRLSELISALPPSVVSKLNGHQDNPLIISRTLQIPGHDFSGLSEEDSTSRQARAAAFQNAITTAKAATTNASPAKGSSSINNSRAAGGPYNYGANTMPRSNQGVGSGNYVRHHQAHQQPLAAWQTPSQSQNNTHSQSYNNNNNRNPYPQPYHPSSYPSRPQPYTPATAAAAASAVGIHPRPSSSSNARPAHSPSAYNSSNSSHQAYQQRAQATQGLAAAAGSYTGYGRAGPGSPAAASSTTSAQLQSAQRPTSAAGQRPLAPSPAAGGAGSPFRPPTANMVASPSSANAQSQVSPGVVAKATVAASPPPKVEGTSSNSNAGKSDVEMGGA
ncbi:MAG: hypothetical protein M1828_003644 [Chrysothrix sp. TS-e1954]|nr:MAG: hypothetical protein M1828_003644 [Chrysothrix sp. TS-e1954]